MASGVSIVSDGELGKVGYSTYVNQRLSGFGGHVDRVPAKDLADLYRDVILEHKRNPRNF